MRVRRGTRIKVAERPTLTAVAVAALSALLAGLAPVKVDAADILAVHSYHPEYPWGREWQAGLTAELSQHDITTAHLDTKRQPKKAFAAAADRVWRTFEAGDFDAVVLGDDNALDLLGQRLADATDVPILYLSVNANPRSYFESIRLPNQVSGVEERPLLGLNVRFAQRVLPEVDKVLVLLDRGTTGRAVRDKMENVTEALGRTSVTTRMLADFRTWKHTVRTAAERGHDVIIPVLYFRQRTPDGETVPSERVMRWTHDHTPVPLLGFQRFSVGKGKAMAGVVLDGTPIGAAAGRMVREALRDGTPPPPRTMRGGKLVVSRAGFERWDLEMPDFERDSVKVVP